MTNKGDTPKSARRTVATRLERARAAAKLFCRQFGFPEQYAEQLEGDPIQNPLVIERGSQHFEVFRWLGHGRGAPIVQVELNLEDEALTVYGGFADQEFGPWQPSTMQ